MSSPHRNSCRHQKSQAVDEVLHRQARRILGATIFFMISEEQDVYIYIYVYYIDM